MRSCRARWVGVHCRCQDLVCVERKPKWIGCDFRVQSVACVCAVCVCVWPKLPDRSPTMRAVCCVWQTGPSTEYTHNSQHHGSIANTQSNPLSCCCAQATLCSRPPPPLILGSLKRVYLSSHHHSFLLSSPFLLSPLPSHQTPTYHSHHVFHQGRF